MNTEKELIKAALVEFIIQQSNLEKSAMVEGETDLFGAGLLDSLAMVSLIAFCEERFKCQIDASELSPDNFGTPNALANLIIRKMNG